ncbi:MAG: dTDP-4-dehydrorhamnose 3,5-epimerase [Bacteroidota bacterium]
MPFHPTPIADLIVFEPQLWKDERGYFYESYNFQTFAAAGIRTTFIQDNEAKSTYGVLRGLHYQVAPYAQAKLVRVLEGEVLDVAVDLRPHSETYGQSYSIRLSAENKKQLFVPRGFAHGYVVLSETAIFAYKVDNYYSKKSEGGVMYNDPKLDIDWQIVEADVVLSEKDKVLPEFGAHRAF